MELNNCFSPLIPLCSAKAKCSDSLWDFQRTCYKMFEIQRRIRGDWWVYSYKKGIQLNKTLLFGLFNTLHTLPQCNDDLTLCLQAEFVINGQRDLRLFSVYVVYSTKEIHLVRVHQCGNLHTADKVNQKPTVHTPHPWGSDTFLFTSGLLFENPSLWWVSQFPRYLTLVWTNLCQEMEP